MRKILVIAVATMLMVPVAHAAGEHDAAVRNLVNSKFKAWTSDPSLIDAIRAQNKANSGLTQSDIDALDKKWRAETSASAKPMIDEMLGRPASKRLLDLEIPELTVGERVLAHDLSLSIRGPEKCCGVATHARRRTDRSSRPAN